MYKMSVGRSEFRTQVQVYRDVEEYRKKIFYDDLPESQIIEIEQQEEEKYYYFNPELSDGIPESMGEKALAKFARQLKNQIALKRSIEDLKNKYGIERLVFLTLTFSQFLDFGKEEDQRVASKVWNNFNRRVMKDNFLPEWVIAIEPQSSGRIHYHVLCVVAQDVRTGFNFDQIRDESLPDWLRWSSANDYLKDLWSILREKCPAYGFGRHELLPIKTGDAIGDYIGKYLTKTSSIRCGFKFQRLRYSRPMVFLSCENKNVSVKWARNSTQFSPLKSEWRDYLSIRMMLEGVNNFDDVKRIYGKRWVWTLKQDFTRYCEWKIWDSIEPF